MLSKKTVHDKLAEKVNNLDTTGFFKKYKYDTDKEALVNKISDANGVLKKLDYNAKITEIEKKNIEDLKYRHFIRFSDVDTGNYIYFWKSKGLSDEIITAPNTSYYSLHPQVSYVVTTARV